MGNLPKLGLQLKIQLGGFRVNKRVKGFSFVPWLYFSLFTGHNAFVTLCFSLWTDGWPIFFALNEMDGHICGLKLRGKEHSFVLWLSFSLLTSCNALSPFVFLFGLMDGQFFSWKSPQCSRNGRLEEIWP